ncbi:MAG: hypothetical protein ACPHQ9_12685, partial [Marinobacter sp.]|uniref:hypothetical protein n=1 Tax=Marinobacter sp. TaxID=50741 RepID=UPI003C5B0727
CALLSGHPWPPKFLGGASHHSPLTAEVHARTGLQVRSFAHEDQALVFSWSGLQIVERLVRGVASTDC